jgi:hypothetical protein
MPTTPAETPLALTRRARRINKELAVVYPDAHCELDFTNALELSVATIEIPRICASTPSEPKEIRSASAGAVARIPEIAPARYGRWLGPGS